MKHISYLEKIDLLESVYNPYPWKYWKQLSRYVQISISRYPHTSWR